MLSAWTYCGYDDVKERLNLAGVGFDTATYTSATLAPLQQNAQNQIDGALTGYYKAPFSTTVPVLIEELCAMMTSAKVYDMIVGYDQFKINETVDYYKKIIFKTIRDLKKRELTLGSTFEINASQYFIGNTTTTFDFSSSSTSWFDID